MGAVAATKRPPRVTVYEEVEVDVDPEDLESAGWVYVGKDDAAPVTSETVLDTVKRWHDDTHGDPWQWCTHPLCDELRRAEW